MGRGSGPNRGSDVLGAWFSGWRQHSCGARHVVGWPSDWTCRLGRPCCPSTQTTPAVPSSSGAPTPGRFASTQPTSTTYTVVSGDNLSTIALHFYGDEGAWGEVWAANSGRLMPDGKRFVDPNLIYVGWTLTLPGISDSPSVTPTKPLLPLRCSARPGHRR